LKPQFVFIGPTKSGTTWIDAYLRPRADVALPVHQKETFFFDKLYDRGLDWYERQFASDGAGGVCIEVAPSLLGKPEAANRLAGDLPGVQVVCTLRHPLDRAVSHYFHYLKTGQKDVGFARMYEAHPDIVTAGLYHKHLMVWIDLLGRQNVHVMLYDEMRSAPDAFCRELCSILGVPYLPPTQELVESRINEASVPRYRWLARLVRNGNNWARRSGLHWLVSMFRGSGLREAAFGGAPGGSGKARVREQAMQFADVFEEDIEDLEKLLGLDLGAWKRQLRHQPEPSGTSFAAGAGDAAVSSRPSS
jgi:hypothetical protein